MAVAFKEWQVICDALASGRQAILLRKGGIHEGREGFSFAHNSFFLFPTRFHAQLDQVREGNFRQEVEWKPGDILEICHHAEVLFAVTLQDWEQVSRFFRITSTRKKRSERDLIGLEKVCPQEVFI